jgi:urea transporter
MMNRALQKFLADESRALKILVTIAVAAMALGLAVAIGAVVLLS